MFRRKQAREAEPSASSPEILNPQIPERAGSSADDAFVQPGSPLGLHVLYEPDNPSAGKSINIVFVHGLGGSAMKTWTYADGGFWPEWLHEWLGETWKLDNIRIATFGYNANYKNIFAAKSILGIGDFAEQLLDGIDLFYDRYDEVCILQLFELTLMHPLFSLHTVWADWLLKR